jgi:multiple sugar transport system permease protein
MTTVPFHRRKETKLVFRYLTAASLVVIFVFPIYWLFAISFKTPGEIFAFPPVWYPKSIQFNNYAVLFKDGDAKTVGNSLVLASVSTFFAMIFGTIAAYSLVRFRTGGENLAVWIISQRMMPPVAVVRTAVRAIRRPVPRDANQGRHGLLLRPPRWIFLPVCAERNVACRKVRWSLWC